MARPVAASPETQARIRELVAASSVSRVASMLKVADATIGRLAGGLPVQPGTLVLAEARIARAAAREPAA